jgi:hypothetical protein
MMHHINSQMGAQLKQRTFPVFASRLRNSAAGWGTAQQAGVSRDPFPMGSSLTQSLLPHYGPGVDSAS